MQDKMTVKFLFLPESDDPDSLVRREGKEAVVSRGRRASRRIRQVSNLGERRVGVDKDAKRRLRIATGVSISPWELAAENQAAACSIRPSAHADDYALSPLRG